MFFETQLKELRPNLIAFARSISRDPDRADDLVQETYLKVWSDKTRFASVSNLKASLFVLLINTYEAELRKRRWEIEDPDDIARDYQRACDDPEMDLRWKVLADAWMQLEPEFRDALRLVVIDGIGYKAAADILGISIRKVKDRIFRARLVLSLLSGEDVHMRDFR